MQIGFGNKKRNTEAKILSLQQAREESKKTIRALRIEMDNLVKQALQGDDLDKKILSLDYMDTKGKLALETERFEDLSTLIGRLQGIRSTDEKLKRLGRVTALYDHMDRKAALREKDRLAIHRSLLEEEQADYEGLYDTETSENAVFSMAPEFERLLREAENQAEAL